MFGNAPMLQASAVVGAIWDSSRKGANITLSADGLTASNTTGSGNATLVQTTLPKSAGKFYWEVKPNPLGSVGRQLGVGIGTSTTSISTSTGATSTSYGWWGPGDGSNEATLYLNNAAIVSNARYRFTQSDILMFAFDIGAGKLWLGKNGSWIDGDPATGLTPSISGIAASTWAPTITCWQGSNAGMLRTSPSKQTYSAPSGFQAGWY